MAGDEGGDCLRICASTSELTYDSSFHCFRGFAVRVYRELSGSIEGLNRSYIYIYIFFFFVGGVLLQKSLPNLPNARDKMPEMVSILI